MPNRQGLPDEMPVDFWYAHTGEEVDRVHLTMNRVTDKQHVDLGWMTRIDPADPRHPYDAGMSLWTLTLELPTDLKATYGFVPLRAGEELQQGPAPEGVYRTRWDQLSPRRPLRKAPDGLGGLSIFMGPGAHSHPVWNAPVADTVSIHRRAIDTRHAANPEQAATRERDIYLYLPENSDSESVPLLVIYDAEDWFGELNLPGALAAAQQRRMIPPIAVIGIANTSRADRMELLGADLPAINGLVEDLLPWAHRTAGERGVYLAGADKTFISGSSLGGLTALRAAATYPEAFAAVSAASPSMWWTPEPASSPRDLFRSTADPSEPDWITQRLLEADPSSTSVRIAVGDLEGPLADRVEALTHTLTTAGFTIDARRYTGGHDYVCWRDELLTDLITFLRQDSPRS